MKALYSVAYGSMQVQYIEAESISDAVSLWAEDRRREMQAAGLDPRNDPGQPFEIRRVSDRPVLRAAAL